MARVSNRVKNYVSAKGGIKQMSLMDTYYKTVELRTVLCDIAYQHKSWGVEWYNLIERSMFDKAQFAVITNGKGDMVANTVEKIAELADLEAHMRTLERGDD